MALKLGIVMDPIEQIKPYKDSSFAMLLAAQARGYELFYMNPNDLYLTQGIAQAQMQSIKVWETPNDPNYFELSNKQHHPLANLDIILIRQDPPFNQDYLYSTQILEMAERQGVLVVNKPQSLRDANEKLFATWFSDCMTDTLVSAKAEQLKDFVEQHQDTIFKPLDAMGGASIFRVKQGDPNLNVIIETLTDHGQNLIMAQKFLPEIAQGDKRILLIDGEPVPYALARIPLAGENRGNLAAGGRGVGQPLSERDKALCARIAPTLKARGLWFVGLDVIGDYITEINVTSPTCIRELDAQFGLNIADQLMQRLEQALEEQSRD
jgi:glutathione synthase